MALPIWGYFFSKAYSDKTLGLEQEADFIQPASMKVESTMDYEDFAEKDKTEPDAENPDAGSGNSEDFFSEEGVQLDKLNDAENEIIEEAKKDRKQSQNTGKENLKSVGNQEEKKNPIKKP